MRRPVPREWHTRYRVTGRTLVVELGGPHRVLSSAPQGGGMTTAAYVLNHQVDTVPIERASLGGQRWTDPARTLRELAVNLGLKGKTVGLMTAVPMRQAVTARAAWKGLWVECLATVGVTNAVRAGEWPRSEPQAERAGTINMILVTNGVLSSSAMVGAVQVATESKTGALRDRAVRSWTGQAGATGTGTDAVVIACRRQGHGPRLRYSGTHTIVGALIGQVVAQCVEKGFIKLAQWERRRP